MLVGLAFALLLGMAAARTRALRGRETSLKDIALRRAELAGARHADRQLLPQPVRSAGAVLRPDRAGAAAAQADLVIVLLSWVFVVTRFAHAGIFVTSNNVRQRGTGVVRRRAGAAGDVDLLRAEDAAC